MWLVVVVVDDGTKDGCGNDGRWRTWWPGIDCDWYDCMRFYGLCPESPMLNYLWASRLTMNRGCQFAVVG